MTSERWMKLLHLAIWLYLLGWVLGMLYLRLALAVELAQ